jgi:hypothetical protein
MTLRRLEKSMPSADNRRANCAAQLAGADVAALKNERTRRARHHRPLTAGSAGARDNARSQSRIPRPSWSRTERITERIRISWTKPPDGGALRVVRG